MARAPTLSHRSAAALWGLRADHRDRTDITLASPSGRSRPGITAHRSATLLPRDIEVVDGIPCTAVARTLLDLAGALREQRDLDRAVEQAEVLRLFDLRAVEDVLERSNGRRRTANLRRSIAAATRPALTASELEERMLHFLQLCAGAGIPVPEVNQWLVLDAGHIRPDFLWRKQGLVVETDGRAFHDNPFASERDHERDLRLRLAGWRVQRYTWRQINQTPQRVVRAVAAELVSGT